MAARSPETTGATGAGARVALGGQPSDGEARVCRACDSVDLHHKFDAMEGGFELLACARCGTLRTWPELADDEVGAWYPQSYYGEGNVRFNALMEHMTHRFAIARARSMANGAPPGRVLDVGCGRGVALAAFRDLGWQAYGVELSEDSASHARDRLGLDVFTGPLADAPYDDESFDLILFWHSLEHFRRPDEAIETARRLLRTGGRLVVAVPNVESVQARVFGKRWFHLDVPRHYHHFGARSLHALLEQRNFVVEDVSFLNLEQNPYGVLQSLMNRLGFPENFLYSLLKTSSARGHEVRKHPGLVAATLMLVPGATALSIGIALFEAGLRRGGTIEMFARKR